MQRPFLFRRLVLAIVALTLVLPTLGLVVPSRAFAALDGPTIKDKLPSPGATPPVTIGANIPEQINAVYENIRWEVIGAGTVAFVNAMQMFFGQLAYDAADYLATGGKGQSALYYKKGFQEYLQDVAGSAAGEFIGSLSEASFFQTVGFDLCRPPDPRTLLRIQLSLGQFLPNAPGGAYQRPQARCDFNDVVNNYEQVYQTLSNGEVLSNVEANLNTNANDLGVSFMIFNRAQEFIYRRQDASQQDRKEGEGYQGLRDIISGRIKTPAETIREQANQVLVKDPRANQEQINSFILNQAWEMGPIRLAMYTASVFVNTFASRMITRVMEDGIGIFDITRQGARIGLDGGPDDLLVGNRDDVRKAYLDLRTPNLFRDVAYDVISEMQACPENRGTWNCTIDEGLAQALRSQGESGTFTIREALERNFLQADWRLFSAENTREEKDPLCYTYGYCVGNLRKLRLMRILPVGFEFAANDPKNIARCGTDQGCVTLGEVVAGFTDCNARGEKDDTHPWCKLIDPNWAISALPQQCALSGYGDVMLGGNLPQRREECQDIQTCLQRNDRGECVGGYGYCVAEKTAYRFGGQECTPRFASCRTYTARTNEEPVSYLRNTLDYGNCSEDNVGCMWYATKRDPSGGRANGWIGTPSSGDRVYFDRAIETCSAEGEGCTRLLAVRPGAQGLNLVANSSFERVGTAGNTQEAWSPFSGSERAYVRPLPSEGEAAANGALSGTFDGGFREGYRQVVDLAPGRMYVLSGFVRGTGAAAPAPSATIALRQYRNRADALARRSALSEADIRRDYRTVDCRTVLSVPSLEGSILLAPGLTGRFGATWSRIECAFTANAATRAGEVVLQGTNVLVDAVQLEEGSVASAYVDGIANGLEQVYHKVAPDEFGCTGDASDSPLCANYAKVCRQTEASCNGYTDLNSTLPEVAAQLSPNDSCPAACVGYAEYRKLSSPFDLVQSSNAALNDATEPRSAFFIPSTAEQCTQEAVGCEEFTVVDGAEAGGENREYYTSLRFCEKPAEDTETYFTWEGSDSAGYQLRTWSLKKRTPTNLGMNPPDGETLTDGAGPRIVTKPSGELFQEKNPQDCNDANWRTGRDQDCRQFYNAAGRVFYRYYSQTVLSTPDCRTYRKASTSQDDCLKTGGQFRAQEQACLYQGYAPESTSCTANYAGCRAYAGAEGGNLLTVFTANGTSTTAVTNATVSSESLLVGDRSYRTDVAAGGRENVSVLYSSTAAGLYRVSFWAKASASSTVVVSAMRPSGQDARVVGTLRLTPEWQRVTFGTFEGVPGNRTVLSWTVSAQPSSPVAFFLDEIIVQQLRDVVFVREGTWQTPNQCDENAYGVPEPQAMAGCRAYRDREGQTVNARQFSQLCRPAAIGCREFVDTRNSPDPYRQTFSLEDGAAPAVTEYPADRYIYLIDDRSKRCDAANASCQAFGKPVFSADRQSVTSFETVYLKNAVEKYAEGLCRPSELYCEEFTTAAGREYFKDPQSHLCEYRERVNVSGVAGVPNGTYNGWFVKGGTTPCYPNALGSGQTFQLLNAGDAAPLPGYQGWGGLCPEQESECTEFRDPNDKPTPGSLGRPYYFINNEAIDTRSCNGVVDPARGCVPLRNMSDARLLYSTEATLQRYQSENLQPVSPVDCQANPSQAGCIAVRTGRCVGTRVTDRYAAEYASVGPDGVGRGAIIGVNRAQTTSSTYMGGSCSQNSDCTAEAAPRSSGRTFNYTLLGQSFETSEFQSRVADIRCDRPSLNDANAIVKVRVDRDCAQWLGCATGETVYDPSTNRYREICTKVAMCDRAAEQGGSANYCSSYVNRSSTTTEPVLTAGAFFDVKQYTARPTGIGARDYSGYSIPNAFQVVDLQSRSVSQETAFGAQRSVTERRLTVAVKMPPMQQTRESVFVHTIPPTRASQAEILPKTDPAYTSVPDGMLLCRHRGTGQIGYFLRDEALRPGQEVNCYLALQGGGNIGRFTGLQSRLTASSGGQDIQLDKAYPKSLCRAYPESDAPFGSDIVTAWDMSTNPIRPKQVRSGYENAYACAYGEQCSCSYKRVQYPGSPAPLFFAATSQAVPPGICVGGPRNGQSCLPSEVFDVSSSTSTAAKIAEAANNNQTCGPAAGGGRCVAFSSAEIVRGVMGSCLEYDTTRSRGKPGEETYACLAWNPSPIVGGQEDPYRYIQTAGYFPPQNSGQYYCTSKARPPKSFMLADYSFSYLPSGVTKIGYDDSLVSDGNSGAEGNDPGAYFGGIKPQGSQAAAQCEDADDDQDDDGPFDKDSLGVRLVATGRGEGMNYTETFYGLSPSAIAASTYGVGRREDTSVTQRQQALYEQNMSYIEVRPFQNPNGNGRLACGYQADWVDGVQVDDYDDLEKTGPADRQWRSAFFSEEDLQTYLTRGSESVLTGTGDRPIKMPCISLSDGTDTGDRAELPEGSQCYYKTWEIGYRSTDKKKFVAFQPNTGGFTARDRASDGFQGITSPVYEACDSEKPYYAIRAVFQTDAATQLSEDRITSRDVRGPWRLIGFWVSSCAGKSTFDNRFIYMNVRFQTADICRDLAEVRSKDSNQDAAFTDRVWRESKYSVPRLGIQYGQSYAPFSSALNTGPAGEDPLYQTGGKLAGSSSIRPPTFLASGYDTYYGVAGLGSPKDRYAYLSNLFARIYRVYRYNEQKIAATDRVCVTGVNAGRKCVPDAPAGTTPPASGESVDCRAISGSGACNTAEPPPVSLRVCNALSGINAGQACGAQPESCHLYAMDPRPTTRVPRPLLGSCERQAGWTVSGTAYRREGDARVYSQRDAAGAGAFRCAPGSVKQRPHPTSGDVAAPEILVGLTGRNEPSNARTFTAEGYGYIGRIPVGTTEPPADATYFCTQERELSEECPLEVVGVCTKPAGAGPRTAGTCTVSWQGQPLTPTSVACYADTDCSFGAENFWRNPSAARIPAGELRLDGKYGIVQASRSYSPLTGCGTACRINNSDMGITSYLFVNGAESAAPTFVAESYRFPGLSPLSTALTRPIQLIRPSCDGLTGEALTACQLASPLSCEALATGPQRTACRADPTRYSSENLISLSVSQYQIGACQPLTDLMRAAGDQVQAGTCSEGSARPGTLCVASSPSASFPYQQWASSASTCGALTPTAGEDRCEAVSVESGGRLTPSERCRLPGNIGATLTAAEYYNGFTQPIPESERTLNNDNNACTAEVGYQPDRRLCPDPSNEFCGLIAYDMRSTGGDRRSIDSTQSGIPLPTDVTLGFYTPSYLGLPTSLVPEAAYEYIDYYTPRPPRIAAPASNCPPGTNCGVQDLDRFSFGGITQGILNVVGGQYRSTIKFYGWAAHEQMAIRRLTLDWGDGTVQDFNDVKLKNHKPFCSVQKECYSPSDGFTGLTCQADNDCPITAQACRAMGSCKDKKNLVCGQDRDCRRDGSQDTCEFRAFFGNSADACEATPFEFSHVYTCAPNAASTLPRCSGQNLITSIEVLPTPADVVAPSGGRPGTCFFGGVDGFVTEGRPRPVCSATGDAGAAECRRLYGSILGIADVSRPSAQIPEAVFNAISCGPRPVSAAPVLRTPEGAPLITQARCSRDTTRFCRNDNDCAAGDQCIAAGIAPPSGCWDDQNDACRFTPRVFIQDNWGWCTGECRTLKAGEILTDSPTSGVKHPFGGCFTPVPVGAQEDKATRLNTEANSVDSNSLTGFDRETRSSPKLECSIDLPSGPFTSTGASSRRSYRPWIVFPGSVQLRPRN